MNNDNNNDVFDRTFFGKPGCMIILIVGIIIFFTLKEYFNF